MASQKGASWNLHSGDVVKKCAQENTLNVLWVRNASCHLTACHPKTTAKWQDWSCPWSCIKQRDWNLTPTISCWQLVLEDQETVNITKPTAQCSTKCRNHRLKVHQPGSPNRWYNVLRGLGVILYSVTVKHQLMQAMEVSPCRFGGFCYCYFMLLCHQELRTCKMYPKFSTCTLKSWKSYQCILIRTVTIHQVWSS